VKPKMLVNPYHARTISSPEEVERLLSQGWLLAKPKARTKRAAGMRTLRERRRAAGWLQVFLWLTPTEVAAITAAKRPRETYAQLLVRLVRTQSSLL
jgi:hypothetical protein